MRWLGSALLVCASGACVIGCGDDQKPDTIDASSGSNGDANDAGCVPEAPPDPPPTWSGPCWPIDTATNTGTVELGYSNPFKPMPSELRLGYGSQAGYMFIVNVRQTGFGGGDWAVTGFPANPRTRIHVYFADTDIPLVKIEDPSKECSVRYGYQDFDCDGVYELPNEVQYPFDTCWREKDLVGKQFRIEAELLDWNGTTYGKDSRIVTALETFDLHGDDSNDPGCP